LPRFVVEIGGEIMSEKIEIKPTPIQRNAYDVAVDLTKIYYESFTPRSVEEIQDTFMKFYAVTKRAPSINHERFIPDNMK
jgi:hypothetical protein